MMGRITTAAAVAIKYFRQAVKIAARTKKVFICLISMGILSIIALGDYFASGVVRRTIVFYSSDDGTERVEERFLAHTGSYEDAIKAFVEEMVLGPSDWDAAPLLDRATVLDSLFLRDRTVYAALSREAALPVETGSDFGGLLFSLESMKRDIRRNFPDVRDVRFFIAGRDTGS
ncbi:MAG: GerMN domain-containing protein [Spirochaetaceae bacterium]|jgi:hypothetical protein|nr:GerMN domain-containing protein [Spirochaetaceae bacterium]